MAAYGRSGDEYRFYELDPLIIQTAEDQFTFLRDSGAKVEVVAGDGRLALERERERRFDVLAVDAFSGDSIPVHLLTRRLFSYISIAWLLMECLPCTFRIRFWICRR
jgi:spermidine synthase